MLPKPVAHESTDRVRNGSRVWYFAVGYFLCYVPYSALTKWLSTSYPGSAKALSGLALLPATVLASVLAMLATFSMFGFWRHATLHRLSVGRVHLWVRGPTLWTAISGVATAVILLTTTLAYTFEGVSIPFVMLLMRGGVLLAAPLVDALSKRKVAWFSWCALLLSALSLADAVLSRGGRRIPMLCTLDVLAYVASYFLRLQLMSRFGKSELPETHWRYFSEEQMVAAPVALILLAGLAWLAPPQVSDPLRAGFRWIASDKRAGWAMFAGVCSQGTGVFGGLVLLDARENSFCVPLNRAASILAGLAASLALYVWGLSRPPSGWELAGAMLLVLAITMLWLGPKLDAKRLGRRAAWAAR
jgi:hypothetical protein